MGGRISEWISRRQKANLSRFLSSGGDGDDDIEGGSGSDTMYGDAGDDFFSAQDGATDLLTGGTGSDSYLKDDADQLGDTFP